MNGIDKICAADLVEMQAFSESNRGVRYLLTVIDVFSKYGWMLPLKDKIRQNWKICHRRVQGDFQKIKAKTRKALDRHRPRVLQQRCGGVGCRALLY